MFFPLEAPIKSYAWGSQQAISRFRGAEPTGEPEAEQWFGDHPESDTRIRLLGHQQPFDDWLRTGGSQFPLLVKLLAAAQPLSIQVHPTADQAAEGFAAEERLGVDIAERTYRDASAKPELLVALADGFRALVGLVDDATISRRLEMWQRAGLDAETVSVLANKLVGPRGSAIRWLLEAKRDVHDCVRGVQNWVESQAPGGSPTENQPAEIELFRELCSYYPADPGILFSLLMHHVVLERGEGLFVEAGKIHAYLEGFGIEVMLPSDNVVRAGLTGKKKDTAEFLKVADLSVDVYPPVIRPIQQEQAWCYEGFAAGFRVTHIVDPAKVSLAGSTAIVIVESGNGAMSGRLNRKDLVSGDVAFVSADEQELVTTDEASVWIIHPTGAVPKRFEP